MKPILLAAVVLAAAVACGSDDDADPDARSGGPDATASASGGAGGSGPDAPGGSGGSGGGGSPGATGPFTPPPGSPNLIVQAPTNLAAPQDDAVSVYTCGPAGPGTSPPVSWTPGPRGTVGYAVTIVDVDAGNFVHWALFGLPVTSLGVAGGLSPGTALPPGAVEGPNSRGQRDYAGPCPPPGKPHRYEITVWALSRKVTTMAELDAAAVGRGTVTALFQR